MLGVSNCFISDTRRLIYYVALQYALKSFKTKNNQQFGGKPTRLFNMMLINSKLEIAKTL